MSGEAAATNGDRPLARGLGQSDATMLVVGSMIGSGIFIVSAESSRLVGAPGWLMVAWALAGVMTITGAMCCAELAAMMPRAGGQYVFLREAYSPGVAFVFGWALLLVVQTGTIAAVAVAFANFAGVLLPSVSATRYVVAPIVVGHLAVSLSTQQLLAIASILFLTWANTRGLRTGKGIQNVFTIAKTGALAGLIVIGLTAGVNHASAAFTASWWHPAANGWTPAIARPGFAAAGRIALAMLLGQAMVGPLFAQSAWNNVTFAGGEVRDPARSLPRALLIGCALVVALYLLANIAYVVTLPFDAIQHAPQNRVATAAMEVALGRPGIVFMAAAIMVSAFGCNNGLILAGARVTYAMASDGLFFASIGRLNAKQVPQSALIVQGVWASLLVLPRSVTRDATTGALSFGNVYTQLLEYIVPADLVMYAAMVLAVIVFRRCWPAVHRPYRTPALALTTTIYVVLALLLVTDLAWLAPATSGIGYLIVASGIPVYMLWRHARRTSFLRHTPASLPTEP